MPTYDEDVILDDDSGDSPSLILRGEHEGDIEFFNADANPGSSSDGVIRLADAAGESRLEIQDSGDSIMAYVTSDGDASFSGSLTAGILVPNERVGLGTTQLNAMPSEGTGDTYGLHVMWQRTTGGGDLADFQCGAGIFNWLDYDGSDTTGPVEGIHLHNLLYDGNIGESGTERDLVGLHVINSSQSGGVIYGNQIGIHLEHIAYATISGLEIMVYLHERGPQNADYAIYHSGPAPSHLGGDLILSDGKWIGGGSSEPRIAFDNTNDYIEMMGGKVGIGTASPSTLLHLYDSAADVALRLETDKADGASWIYFVNDATSWTAGIAGGDDFQIRDAALCVLQLTASDNALTLPNLATDSLKIKDAGTAAATEDGWIAIEIDGGTQYVRTHTSK